VYFCQGILSLIFVVFHRKITRLKYTLLTCENTHYLVLLAHLRYLKGGEYMQVTDLPEEIRAFIQHIKHWESQISDPVAALLLKLWNEEPLSRSELGMDVTPSELAAIWSITNQTPIKPGYTRQVKRAGRITPSKEWGTGTGYRCLYRVRMVKDIKVGHERGRPRKSVKEEEAA
jgi:hypothetical protein